MTTVLDCSFKLHKYVYCGDFFWGLFLLFLFSLVSELNLTRGTSPQYLGELVGDWKERREKIERNEREIERERELGGRMRSILFQDDPKEQDQLIFILIRAWERRQSAA